MVTQNMHLPEGLGEGLSDRQKRIYTFLYGQQLGVLSTITTDDKPHGTVIYYSIDTDFCIHILTKKGTRKYDNLLHNNQVMLTVSEPRSQVTAQVTGVATELSDREQINQVAHAIFSKIKHGQTNDLPPIIKLQAGAFTTFRIKPTQIRIATYVRPKVGDYDELFESIESFELHTQL